MKAFEKTWLVTTAMLWQNRWLLLVLILWPWAMMAILLWPRGDSLQADDVLAILHQEAYYGMALVAISASTQLGKEQRSRRTLQVLSRAMGRTHYLCTLGLSAWLPFLAYMVSFTLSTVILVLKLHAQPTALPMYLVTQFAAAVLVGGIGLLFSVALPTVFASIATLAVIAGLSVAGAYGAGGPCIMLAWLSSMTLAGHVPVSAFDLGGTILLGVVCFAAACVIFNRRDLDLTTA